MIQVRFLCDAMLVRLARWLRAAGHDTLIAGPGAADTALVALAEGERRILLTCDRALVRLAEERVLAVLLSDRASDQALRLRETLGLDWLAAPFTRCLIDNCPLEETTPDCGAIPEAARMLAGPFYRCPCCGRNYWPGSHVRRMMNRLVAWNALPPAQPSGHA